MRERNLLVNYVRMATKKKALQTLKTKYPADALKHWKSLTKIDLANKFRRSWETTATTGSTATTETKQKRNKQTKKPPTKQNKTRKTKNRK